MRYYFRNFSLLFSVVVFVFFYLLLRQSSDSSLHQQQIENITNLTMLPGIALSSSNLEDRIAYYGDYSNRFYLDIKPYTYRSFVYAK